MPWPAPIAPTIASARCAGKLELGGSQRGDTAQVPDREVNLPEQEDEDDTEGDHRHARHLEDDVDEVRRGEEVRRGQAEEDDDRKLAEDDREDTEVARFEVVTRGLPHAGSIVGPAPVR
jgi:hypothetical protein